VTANANVTFCVCGGVRGLCVQRCVVDRGDGAVMGRRHRCLIPIQALYCDRLRLRNVRARAGNDCDRAVAVHRDNRFAVAVAVADTVAVAVAVVLVV
jgi:hypothetical protein